jgi:NTE family protein
MYWRISLNYFFLATILLLAPAGMTWAAQCLQSEEGRPRIGLVLGGGGARGTAHIGVIKALEELRVPVDYIAGTSMGALLGGLSAAGMTSDDLQELAVSIDWADIFKDGVSRRDRPFRRKRDDDLGLYGVKIGLSRGGSTLPRGAVAGQKIDFLLESLVSQRTRADDFDELPIPFRAVAVDIMSAATVVLSEGRLSKAMRSSMALPAVFDPVENGEQLLVDGGVLMNLPISVAQDMGADVIIAVDVGSPLEPRDKVNNILQILYQLTGVVTIVNTREQISLLGDDDVLLVPPLGTDITTGSFAAALDAIPIGYAEAMNYREQLSSWSISEADWQRRQLQIQSCTEGLPTIEFLRVNNDSRFADEVIYHRLHVEFGQTLDLQALESDLDEIYALGFLQRVQYRIVEEGDRAGLEIDVVDDSRGTKFFEYGFGVTSTSRSSDFNMRLAYLQTDVTKYGGEFRGILQIGQDLGAGAEFYLPLSKTLKPVFVPRAAIEQSNQNIFDANGNKISQYSITESIFDVALGYEFSRNLGVFAAVRAGSGKAEVNIGDPFADPFDFNRGEYQVRALYDSQDDRYFPKSGLLARFVATRSDSALGADQNYNQYETRLFDAWTRDRHTFFAALEYDISSNDPIPIQSLYQAGGFPRLSGFSYDELIGENFGMVLGGYRYQLLESSILPGYLGGTIEYGNVARHRSDVFSDGILNGSVYFGVDSIVGPLYLGVGFAEGGRYSGFLTIGSIFVGESLVR